MGIPVMAKGYWPARSPVLLGRVPGCMDNYRSSSPSVSSASPGSPFPEMEPMRGSEPILWGDGGKACFTSHLDYAAQPREKQGVFAIMAPAFLSTCPSAGREHSLNSYYIPGAELTQGFCSEAKGCFAIKEEKKAIHVYDFGS